MFITEGYEVFKHLLSEKECTGALRALDLVKADPGYWCTKHMENQGHLDYRLRSDVLPEEIVVAKDRISELLRPLKAERFRACQVSYFPAGNEGWKDYHLDNVGAIDRGEMTFDNGPGFTTICGVALTDLSVPDSGNLIVIPGGQNAVAEYFQSDSSLSKQTNPLKVVAKYFESNPGQQVLLSAGDLVIMQYLMPHRVARNNRGSRPMLYFRFGVSLVNGELGYSLPQANFRV